jgi:hypothetical protein
MKRLFNNWGAVIILALMFIGSWAGQWIFQWSEYVSTQEAHNQSADISGFAPEFFASTLENWQSEFLQLVFQAVLVASWIGGRYLFRADYAADKDDMDRLERKIDQLLANKVTDIRE